MSGSFSEAVALMPALARTLENRELVVKLDAMCSEVQYERQIRSIAEMAEGGVTGNCWWEMQGLE